MFDFNKFLSTLNNEPQWLKDKRKQAWESFSQLPMPSGNEEGWRVLDLDLVNLEVSEPCTRSNKNLSEITESSALLKDIKTFVPATAGTFVFSPEGIWHELSAELSGKGVIVGTLSEMLSTKAELLKPYLEQILAENKKEKTNELVSEFCQSSKFALLNQALCTDTIIVYIPKNTVIENPLICLNLLDDSRNNFVHLLLIAEEHAQASVINILSTDKASAPSQKFNQNNFLLQVFANPSAHLNYAEVQNFGENAFSISHSYFTQERDSQLHTLIAAIGGGQLKGEIRNILKDRGAESSLNGVVLGADNERFNFNTIEDHMAPDTKSSIDFRVALKDQSQSIYHGNIQVSKIAQKTEAFQSNKNLLLGAKSHADSIPKLEILADDVKCSHGATVGPVDRNQVFYLMSRGLDAVQAEELIVNGFFHQVLANCSISGVADWLDSLVADKIHASSKVIESNARKLHHKEPALTR